MGNHKSKLEENNINNLPIGIKTKISCPLCGKVFDTSKSTQQLNDHLILCGKHFDTSKTIQQFNDHLMICGTNFMKDEYQCEMYLPSDDTKLNKTILKNAKDYKLSKLTLAEKSKKYFN